MKLLEIQHPFLRPLWRRWVVVAVCLGWAAVEFATANPFWGVLFAALGAAAFWQLFLTPWPDDNGEPD